MISTQRLIVEGSSAVMLTFPGIAFTQACGLIVSMFLFFILKKVVLPHVTQVTRKAVGPPALHMYMKTMCEDNRDCFAITYEWPALKAAGQ